MQGALRDIGLGILGAMAATKLAPMIPIQDPKMKNAAVAGAGILIAMKAPNMRALGVGMGIAGGTLVLNEFFPNLLGTGTVGRLSPAAQAQMEAAAARIRQRINGARQRTIVGTGEAGNYPQPVNGYRQRTIVGSGEQDIVH